MEVLGSITILPVARMPPCTFGAWGVLWECGEGPIVAPPVNLVMWAGEKIAQTISEEGKSRHHLLLDQECIAGDKLIDAQRTTPCSDEAYVGPIVQFVKK